MSRKWTRWLAGAVAAATVVLGTAATAAAASNLLANPGFEAGNTSDANGTPMPIAITSASSAAQAGRGNSARRGGRPRAKPAPASLPGVACAGLAPE